jgi:3-hydroxyisobutyrate dehydrogenase-like beta-hydroxyacid dehydrogenase
LTLPGDRERNTLAQVTVGLLHPGEMGSVVGGILRAAGAQALWASEGRSRASRERARAASLTDVITLAALVAESGVILSVCPPHAAMEVARQVAAQRFTGVYLDANAVSPATARAVAGLVEGAGARFVDGGIVGPPPKTPETTRLYLSGKEAGLIAALFEAGPMETIILDGPPGAASALKVAYAAYTKGTSALLLAIRALAIREGVDDALLQEWTRSLPDLSARTDAALRGGVRKAWRFVGEMEENAATFAEAGIPDGFSRAAADVYRRLAGYKDAKQAPSATEVAAVLGGR